MKRISFIGTPLKHLLAGFISLAVPAASWADITNIASATFTDSQSNPYTVFSNPAVTATNQAPVVSLTSPANGATYTAPASISLNATASDSDGTITKMEFYQGTTLLATDTASPYSYSWTSVGVGSYQLTAKAYDNSGASTVSSAVTVTVTVNAANQAPTVSLTSPANGATYTAPASISLNATASDSDGTVTKVEFYQGTTLLATDTASPYSYSWTGVGVGSYQLTAKAYDNSGASTISSAVTVTVTVNATLPPPDLSNIADVVQLTDSLSLKNGSSYSNVSITWTFAPASGTGFGAPSLTGGNATLGTISFAAGSNTGILASKGLQAGNYLLTVQVTDLSNPSIKASTSKTIAIVQADLSQTKVYPNPWRAGKHDNKPVTFNGLPTDTTVKIFTVSGRLVRTLTGSGSLSWDLKNDSGDHVASGIYLYLITDSQGGKARGKLAIIR